LLSSAAALGPATIQTGFAYTAHARQATTLDALPFSHAAAVSVLTPSKPGAYHGFSIDHGLQFIAHNSGSPDSALEFHLGGHFASLTGTVYSDSAAVYAPLITIQDVSDPVGGVKQIFQSTVNGQLTFNLDVHGVQDISIGVQKTGDCCGTPNPAVADLVAILTGGAPATITVIAPTGSGVIPSATPIAFDWKSYAGAAAYVLDIALVKQSTKQALTSATKLSFTKLIVAMKGSEMTYFWNPVGSLPGIYQYDVRPVDRYGNAMAGRSAVLQFTIAG
jgi:hypothetical protein